LTSIKKATNGVPNWLGDLAAALMPPKDPSTDGDCLAMNAIGLVGVSCDAVSNFVCQALEPGGVSKPTASTTQSSDPLPDNA
jgi:hypothetical protein